MGLISVDVLSFWHCSRSYLFDGIAFLQSEAAFCFLFFQFRHLASNAMELHKATELYNLVTSIESARI
jgi:hypothetical protein